MARVTTELAPKRRQLHVCWSSNAAVSVAHSQACPVLILGSELGQQGPINVPQMNTLEYFHKVYWKRKAESDGVSFEHDHLKRDSHYWL